MAKDGLTENDILFIDEYFCNNFNATKAYSFVWSDAPYKNCKALSYRLTKKPFIKQEIDRRWKEIEHAAVIKREEIMFALRDTMIDAIDNKDNQALLKTIDIINKMSGHYTTQIDANIIHNINLTIPGLEEDKNEE